MGEMGVQMSDEAPSCRLASQACSANTVKAFSISHSIVRAFPAISANSWPGSRERIKVAELDFNTMAYTRI